jgi:DNA-binding CsgD family transcriptional regulator
MPSDKCPIALAPASCETLPVIPLVRMATKKPEFLARRTNGQRSAHANGDASSRPLEATKPAVAIGHADEPEGIARLSPRQLAAVNLLFKGLSYREISESLGISLFTVRSHLHSAYKRLQVKSRGQAVARILRETSRNPETPNDGHNLDLLSYHSPARTTLTKR